MAALPLTAFVVAASMLALTLAMDATVRTGEVAGSWESVGGDVAATRVGVGALPEAARSIESFDGVDAAATAWIMPTSQLLGGGVDMIARVVAVDPAEFEALLAGTPFDDAPQLALLEGAAEGEPIPILTRDVPPASDGLTVLWEGSSVSVVQVGSAPPVPGDVGVRMPTVFIDENALADAIGRPVSSQDAPSATGSSRRRSAWSPRSSRCGRSAPARSGPHATT